MAKLLPYNINAEKIVLGSMIVSKAALENAITRLTVETFYGEQSPHQLVYQAITNLYVKKVPVDVQTLTDELILQKSVDSTGGITYLKELTDTVLSLTNLEFYIKILQDHKILRDLLTTIDAIRQDYNTQEIDEISDFVGLAEKRIREVTAKRRISGFQTTAAITEFVENELKELQRQDGISGVETGFRKLDQFTHGLQKGEMTILAARPSVGKTAFALNIAYNATRRNAISAAVFSLEMPASTLVRRLLATDATVSLDRMQNGTKFLTATERAQVAQALRNVADAKLLIDDSPGLKLIDIIAKSRQLKASTPDLGLIVVDYIGLITSGDKRIESRQVEVSNISRQLKELARELSLPILVVSQLSREVDKRDTRKPILSDLRESGSIEQDADMVFLMYRPGYYKSAGYSAKSPEDRKAQKEQFEKEEALTREQGDNAQLVEIRVAKNRNGRIGTVPLIFFASYGRFDNPSQDYETRLKAIRDSQGYADSSDD
jgi:replicative DNA helicase